MAKQRRNRSGDGPSTRRARTRRQDTEGIFPVLAKAVRAVETAVDRGQVTAEQRSRFQAIALLARVERARIRADAARPEAQRNTELRRLEGVATILARIATREPSLWHLLEEDAEVSDATRRMQREMRVAAGVEPAPDADVPSAPSRRPRSVPDGSRRPGRWSRPRWPTRSSRPTSAR